jgi:hypothetical protein
MHYPEGSPAQGSMGTATQPSTPTPSPVKPEGQVQTKPLPRPVPATLTQVAAATLFTKQGVVEQGSANSQLVPTDPLLHVQLCRPGTPALSLQPEHE